MSNSPKSGNTSVSLVGKLQSLEEVIHHMRREMNTVIREVQLLRSEKSTLDGDMTNHTLDVKQMLSFEVTRTESEMRRVAAGQQAENNRLLAQLAQLRWEKETIQQKVQVLQERIKGLEQLIGGEVQMK